jgi:lysophospholipase L1-like esterase
MRIRNVVLLSILFAASLSFGSEFYPLFRAEDNFEAKTGIWLRPDLGTKDTVLPLKTRLWATKESVTGGAALKIVMEKGSKGSLSHEMEMDKFKGTAGVTFFAKASRPLKVKVGNATADVGTEWKKIDLAWDAVGKFDWKGFMITVVPPVEEKTWLIIDRVGSEGPTFDTAPKIEEQKGPDETLNSKDIHYGVENLSKTLANLKAKKPFKIVAIGDSVTAGAQMSRGTPAVQKENGIPFLYFSHFARLLEEHFGYKGVTPVQNGKGGFTAKQGNSLLDASLPTLTADDVVILEFGANDMGYGARPLTPPQWKADMKALIAKAKTKTDQIIIMSPTIGGFIPKLAPEITKAIQEIVSEDKVAAADITKLCCYRGEPYSHALMANQFHPDYMGHIIMAEMMAPMLTEKHIAYPE